MMKKLVFIFAITFSLSSVFAQETIEISGKIEGLGNESMVLRYRFDGTNHLDTITAKNDVISFKKQIKLQNPIMATLTYIGKNENLLRTSTEFFINNGIHIRLSGDLNHLYDVTATNSPFFNDVKKLREENKELNLELWTIIGRLTKERETLSEDEQKILVERHREISGEIGKNMENFIENNKNSVYAAYLYSLNLLGKSVEEVEGVFNKFTEEVRNSEYGKQIHTYLENAKRVVPGAQAANFTQKDINGNTVTLEQFKGKHVMLVFWGSWCGPCRRSHPHLVELVDKYRNDIQFIGFASDRDKDKWKEAIEKDKLDFIHCNLFDKLDGEDVAPLYNVRAFPTKVFIDPQGKIIRTIIGGDAEELDELLQTTIGK